MQQQESTLQKLQTAISNDPGNAELVYLLGAEFAAQRQYDSAVEQFNAALAIEPNLHTARLQLGLLLLTMAKVEQAMAILEPLDALGDQSPFAHFKLGLQALASDRFDDCIAALERGISLNTENDALNKDMQKIIDRVAETMNAAAQPAAAPEETPPQREESEHRTDFSLYDTDDD